MKHLLIPILVAVILTLYFTSIVQTDVIREQLQSVRQLKIEKRHLVDRIDKLLEELAGIKIEKGPDELFIH